jgi:hypothetical protein
MEANATEEALVRLKDVPKLPMIGPRRNGGRLDVRTVFRWAKSGSSGVVLWSVVQGGPALHQPGSAPGVFEEVTTAKAQGQKMETSPKTWIVSGEVEAKLDRLGF